MSKRIVYLDKVDIERAQQYLKYLRNLLPTLVHVSGDECEHCGVREQIAEAQDVIANGYYVETD